MRAGSFLVQVPGLHPGSLPGTHVPGDGLGGQMLWVMRLVCVLVLVAAWQGRARQGRLGGLDR